MDYDEKAAKRKMNIKSKDQLPSTELPLPEAQCVSQGVRETEEIELDLRLDESACMDEALLDCDADSCSEHGRNVRIHCVY